MKIILLAFALMLSCGKSPVQDRLASAQPLLTTPTGFRVRAEAGVNVNAAQIDEGANRVFTKAKCVGYAIGLEPSRYDLVFLKADGVRDGVPYIAIPVGKYKGTEFDHNGKQFMAGEFVEPSTLLIVSADAQQDLAGIAEHELTHAIYFANNKARYKETQIHTGGEFLLPACASRR